MQPGSKIFDDMSKLMNNAMGVAQGAKAEASTAMKSLLDRWLADRDFVTREEFDAVKAMAQKAREENSRRKPEGFSPGAGDLPADSNCKRPIPRWAFLPFWPVGGAREDRTPDLLNAILTFCVSSGFLGLHCAALNY
jgi:hypothetical protein